VVNRHRVEVVFAFFLFALTDESHGIGAMSRRHLSTTFTELLHVHGAVGISFASFGSSFQGLVFFPGHAFVLTAPIDGLSSGFALVMFP